MLQAIRLSKSYGTVPALRELDLEVKAGEVFCLLGANGAGKTTTIHLFLNFIAPSSGIARIKGIDVAERPLEAKRHVAYIPEQVTLYPQLSGLENLEYFASLGGAPPDADWLGVLAEVGLGGDAAQRRVSTYSKGMRQKVGIAIARAKRADVLLLDEPTSGLDPQAANEFSELVGKLSRSGAAVLMATHDLFRAAECGTRAGIMRGGRLVAVHATHEIGHAELERIYLEHMREGSR
jgi:ABC-2 type transport system ATP-binding protein